MNGSILDETVRDRDIGLIISNKPKPAQQCLEEARRAWTVLTQISRAFLCRNKNIFIQLYEQFVRCHLQFAVPSWSPRLIIDKKIFIQLYKQFVRCHLEFAVPSWSTWLIGDIEVLERSQKRAVNLMVGLVGQTYEEKLTELGLSTMKDRRIQLDLIQTFKLLKGLTRLTLLHGSILLEKVLSRLTRNTAYESNLLSNRSNTDQRKNFFTNRVPGLECTADGT